MVILSVIIIFLLAYFFGQTLKLQAPVVNNTQSSECNPSTGKCHFNVSGIPMVFYFEHAPSSMTPFDIVLETESHLLNHVSVSFSMMGMEMGENSSVLKHKQTKWQGSVILPVCSLARNDWRAEVLTAFSDQKTVTSFYFRVNESE